MPELDDLYTGIFEALYKDISETKEAINFDGAHKPPPSDQVITNDEYWQKYQQARTANGSALYALKQRDMVKLNKLQKIGLENSTYWNKKVFNHVKKKDVLVYAVNKQLPWPLWGTIGEIRYGIKHIMTEYDIKVLGQKVDVHEQHWDALKTWADISDNEDILIALQKFSDCLATAKVKSVGESKKNQGLSNVLLLNEKNNNVLLLSVVTMTGFIISGWCSNV